jgi:UDP-N-acetylmuramoyl-tripeptide--D-alanyl-D-alanine ligase
LAKLTLDEVASAVSGRILCGESGTPVEGAAIDSRAVRGRELFFAFRGEQTDGHRFVADAMARGAAAAIVEKPVALSGKGALIEVGDSFQALHDLTRHVRLRLPERLIGITGSAGKTTTKELLGALLADRFRVFWSPGNLNNLYGFPLSLLNVPEGTEWMVAEMGMSTPGELRQLSLLGRPDVALFTVVRPAHLEFFESVAAIAEAKAELLAGLSRDGLIVANADDPEVTRIVGRHVERQKQEGESTARVVWYGIRSPAEVRALDVAPEPGGAVGSRFLLAAGGEKVEVRLPLHGAYNVENGLAAAACAWALGVPLAEIAEAIRAVRPAAMRGVVHRAARGFTLVDDSYNSNPDALGKALAGAASLAGGRRVAVLGAMLELGPEGPRFHREAGERAAELGFTPILAVGEAARELAAGAQALGAEASWVASSEEAAAWLAETAASDDVILVKGSRGVGLERVVRRVLGGGTEGGAH